MLGPSGTWRMLQMPARHQSPQSRVSQVTLAACDIYLKELGNKCKWYPTKDVKRENKGPALVGSEQHQPLAHCVFLTEKIATRQAFQQASNTTVKSHRKLVLTLRIGIHTFVRSFQLGGQMGASTPILDSVLKYGGHFRGVVCLP